MYDDFLKLCGFEQEEIDKENPRIEKAFNILGIAADDIEKTRENLLKTWDLDLVGVRKFLRIGIKQLIACVLARDEQKTIIYINGQALSQYAEATMDTAPGTFVASPPLAILFVFGYIFGPDYTTHILEAAEENGLRAGQAHCGAYQAWLGSLVKGIFPKPDLNYSMGSANCSQNSEADYLVNHLFGVPTVYPDTVDYPHDDTWPLVNANRLQYVGDSMRVAQKSIEDFTGTTIPDEAKKKSLIASGMTFKPLLAIPDLLKLDPLPIGLAELQFAYYVSAMPLLPDLRQDAIQAARLLEKEVKERAERGFGVSEKGAARIFMPLYHAVTPMLGSILKDVGLVPVAQIAICLTQYDKEPAQFKSLEERIQEGLYRKAMWNRGSAIPGYFREICRDWSVDGAVVTATFNCRLMHPIMLATKDILEKELSIPTLRLEMDIYDTRTFTLEQLRTRLETFASIVKTSKKAKSVV